VQAQFYVSPPIQVVFYGPPWF